MFSVQLPYTPHISCHANDGGIMRNYGAGRNGIILESETGHDRGVDVITYSTLFKKVTYERQSKMKSGTKCSREGQSGTNSP